jgi:glycosyltransferase involved in cell wall biosynthesis
VITAYSAYGPAGASTKVRLYDWFDHVGVDAERHEYLGRNANPAGVLARQPLAVLRAERDLRRRASRRTAGTVIVSREVSPLSTGAVEARLLRSGDRGVFDFDDAVWLPVSGPRGRIDQDRKTRRAVGAADVVIAGNEVLADWASDHARDVVLIPSCVEPAHYTPRTTWELDEVPRLVWLGSPSTEQYVVDIAPALQHVWERTGAVLTVISGPAPEPRDLDAWPDFVRRVEWSHETARIELARSDVAIAPLRDDAYARGKCAYKLLQYAASGLPMVGAPVGANALALQRFDSPAATSDAEWVEALCSLLEESSVRRAERAATGLAAVHEHYSFASWADTWLAAVGVTA